MSRMSTSALGPAWLADPKRLTALRERAARRRVIRQLLRGDVKEVFVRMGRSAHKYGDMINNSGQITQLVVMFNALSLAASMHASVLVGNPAVVSVPEGFEEQGRALRSIRSESMLDALLHRGASQSVVDGETPFRVDRQPGKGVVVSMDSVDTCIPVGIDGHDFQPTAWERRWIVERTIDRRKHEFLRVERHRVVNGVGVVEQEAYESRGTDLYADLSKAKAVPLATAVPENTPEPRTVTGLDRNTIVRIVRDFDHDGWPRMMLNQGDIDLLDVGAAAFSRLVTTMEKHGVPKIRVSESMLNEHGSVDVSKPAVVDEEGIFEYIVVAHEFEAMINWLKQVLQLLLVSLQVSPSLIGMKLSEGAMPDTFDKIRLESTGTMTAARTARMYAEPALEDLLYSASVVASQTGLNGWPVGEVDVTLTPEIPADEIDRARSLAEMKREGLISEKAAITRLHGEGAAATILADLETERAAATARNQSALFGAGFGSGGGGA